MIWENEQEWEREWWGACINTFGEEYKQLLYAKKMGIKTFYDGHSPFCFNVTGRILDIGGGPVSMLLKCPNGGGTVIDPCKYPQWVHERYKVAGIEYIQIGGEDISYNKEFDEVWIYNCLQHVQDPAKIIYNALKSAPILRIFEWLEVGISPGHCWNLHEKDMNEWLGGVGKAERINENTCVGLSYYGIFKGSSYG